MQVLVTGGTGFVGNNVVRMLLDHGHEVRVLVRDANPQPCFDCLDVELIEGDICDFESIVFACEGVDAVIHSAAMVHIGWSQLDAELVNPLGGREETSYSNTSSD